MKILVDADACPVVKQVEKIAKKHRVPVILLCDTNHILSSNYSEIKVIGAGADAVDIALANLCQGGDIAVTQDYGVAALVLGKGGYAIHQWENIYKREYRRTFNGAAYQQKGKNVIFKKSSQKGLKAYKKRTI